MDFSQLMSMLGGLRELQEKADAVEAEDRASIRSAQAAVRASQPVAAAPSRDDRIRMLFQGVRAHIAQQQNFVESSIQPSTTFAQLRFRDHDGTLQALLSEFDLPAFHQYRAQLFALRENHSLANLMWVIQTFGPMD